MGQKELYDKRYLEGYREGLSGFEIARWHALRHLIGRSLRLQVAERVLDYGSGSGLHVGLWQTVFPNARLHFCDISPVALEKLMTAYPEYRDHVSLVENNRTRFSGSYFDVVVSVEVMEHVEDLDAYLSEIHRLLQRGGFFIWTAPCGNAFSIEHIYSFLSHQIEAASGGHRRWKWEDPTHLRRLRSVEAKRLLRKHEFTNIGFRFRSQFFSFACTNLCKGRFQKLGEKLMLLDYALFRRLPNGASMLGYGQKR